MQIFWVLRRAPEFCTSKCATRFQILTLSEPDISVDMEVSFEIEIFRPFDKTYEFLVSSIIKVPLKTVMGSSGAFHTAANRSI